MDLYKNSLNIISWATKKNEEKEEEGKKRRRNMPEDPRNSEESGYSPGTRAAWANI